MPDMTKKISILSVSFVACRHASALLDCKFTVFFVLRQELNTTYGNSTFFHFLLFAEK